MQTVGVKNCTSSALFRVNPEKEILLRGGEPIPLTPKTFQILLVLVRHSNGAGSGSRRGECRGGDWIFHEEASALAYSGHLREARTKSRQAVDSAREAIHKQERAAMWEAGAVVREAVFGNPFEARQHAKAALDFSKSRDVEYGAALAFALVGDSARSQALAKDLEEASAANGHPALRTGLLSAVPYGTFMFLCSFAQKER